MAGSNDITVKILAAADFSQLVAEAKAALNQINQMARSGAPGAQEARAKVESAISQRAGDFGKDADAVYAKMSRVVKALDRAFGAIDTGRAERLREKGARKTGSGGDGEEKFDAAKVASERAKARAREAAVATELSNKPGYVTSGKNLALAQAKMAAELEDALSKTRKTKDRGSYADLQQQFAVARARNDAQLQTKLGGDENYTKWKQQAAVALQRQAANLQTALGGDTEYTKWRKLTAVGLQRQAANLQTALGGDPEYRKYTKEVAVARQRQAANLQEDLGGDGDYLKHTKRLAVSRQLLAARSAEDLASSDDYRDHTARLTRAQALQTARLQEALVPTDLADSRARTTVAQTQIAARTQGILADDKGGAYADATAAVAVARQRQAANLQNRLATDDRYASAYAESTAQVTSARQRQAAEVQRRLAEDPAVAGRYADATAQIARARQQQAVNVQSRLADDPQYFDATRRLAVIRQQQQAKLQQSLSTEPSYIEATTRLTSARQRLSANVQQELARSTGFADSGARLASARAQQGAAVQSRLADDPAYAAATKQAAVARQSIAARLQGSLASDDDYQINTALIAAARQRQAATVQELLGGDQSYLQATTRVAAARQQIAAGVQTRLAGDAEYQAATARISSAQQQQAAGVQQRLLGDTKYQEATTQLASMRQQQAAKTQAALTDDPAYKAATQSLAVSRQEQAAQLQSSLATDSNYKAATARVATARAQQQTSLAEDGAYRQATIALTVARRQNQAATQTALAKDPEYATATAQAAVAKEQQAAALRATLAADQHYIEATALNANAKQEQAARISLARAGADTGLSSASAASALVLPGGEPVKPPPKKLNQDERLALLSDAAVMERIQADKLAALTARKSANVENGVTAAAVERRVAEGQLNAALRKEERELMRQRIKSGDAGGSGFQRIQALLSASGKAPSEFQTGPQQLASKGITSAGYMAGGMLSGALMFGTINAIKDASKLQEQFVGLRAQMRALGNEQAFVGVANGIKEISNQTGLAASEVAKFYSRLLGVFSNPTDALRQADAAMKLAVVSGTDLNTMMEELVPVARAFNVGMEEIGDTAVYIKDHFGVAEEATLHFLGEVAPMAEEAGLSLQEMGVIGGTAANSIGKSISAAGEQIAKVFPTMQQNQDKIYAIFRQSPQTAKFVDPMIEAFGSGETGKALKIMLQSWDQLNSVQQESLVHVSGSRREWAVLNGIFAQSGKLLQDMSDAEAGRGGAAGGLERRYDQVSKTLNRTVEQIQQTFKNFVEGTLSSGIGDVFVGMAKGAETLISVLNKVMSIFNDLNETFKIPGIEFPFLAPLLQMGVALTLGTKLMGIFGGAVKMAGGSNVILAKTEDGLAVSVTKRTGAMAEGAATLSTDTGLKEADATATGGLAAAESGLAEKKVVGSGMPVALGVGSGARYEAAMAAQAASGSFIGKSRFLTRAFSGGRVVKTPGLDALSAEKEMAVGGTALPVLGMVAIGAMQVKSAYDEHKGVVQQQSNELRERMKTFGNARLDQIIETQNDVYDQFESALFDEDMPATLAAKEKSRRKGEKGRKVANALMSSGAIDQFAKEMTDQQVAKINEIMSQTQESVDAVEEAGTDVGRGPIGGLVHWVAKTAPKFTPAGLLARWGEDLGLAKGNAKASREDMKKLIPVLERKSAEGNEQASQALVEVREYVESTKTASEVRKKVREAIEAGDINKAIEDAGGIDDFLKLQGYYDPEGMLKTGQISRTVYIDIMRQKVSDLKKQIGKSPDAEKTMKEFNTKLYELQQMEGEVLMESVNTIKMTAPMSQLKPKTAIYNALRAVLPRLPVPQQIAAIPEVIQTGWDSFQEQIGFASSIQDWIAQASAGYDVDFSAQVVQVEKFAKENVSATNAMGRLAEQKGGNIDFAKPENANITGEMESVDDINKIVSERAVREGVSFKEALRRETLERKARFEAIHGAGTGIKYDSILRDIDGAVGEGMDDMGEAVKHIAPDPRVVAKQANTWKASLDKSAISLKAALGGTSPYVQAQADIDIAKREVERIQREMEIAPNPELQTQLNEAKANVAKAYQNQANLVDQTAAAMDNWDVVYAHFDAVRAAGARLKSAVNNVERIRRANKGDERDPALINARQAAQEAEYAQYEAETNRMKGLMELQAFDRNRDPVQAAKDALAQAEYAYSRLSLAGAGETELNAAALQIKQAKRQLDEAIESNLQADAQLALTLLEAKQDPVGAARKAVEEATRRLKRAEQLGLGRDTAEWKQLYGELQNKRVAAIDADVQNQEDIINYLLEMGQITTSEAAARLRVEANKYEVGTKKWRDIQLRIHQLEQGGGADLQFNLPTQLGLPTLYEARRLNQGMGMGMGYQDNRNQTISIQVNGVGDPAATAQQVMQAFQAATGSANVYSGAVSGVG